MKNFSILIRVIFMLISVNSFKVCDEGTCDTDNSSIDNWSDSSTEEIWGWLKTQLRKDLMTFCNEEIDDKNAENLNEHFLSVIQKLTKCETISTEFKGSFDKNDWPKNKGVLHALFEREFKQNLRKDG
jgi:hypothetical protein